MSSAQKFKTKTRRNKSERLLIIALLDARSAELLVLNSTRVHELKKQIEDSIGVPSAQQRLFRKGLQQLNEAACIICADMAGYSCALENNVTVEWLYKLTVESQPPDGVQKDATINLDCILAATTEQDALMRPPV